MMTAFLVVLGIIVAVPVLMFYVVAFLAWLLKDEIYERRDIESNKSHYSRAPMNWDAPFK
jgi:hypothetical protein